MHWFVLAVKANEFFDFVSARGFTRTGQTGQHHQRHGDALEVKWELHVPPPFRIHVGRSVGAKPECCCYEGELARRHAWPPVYRRSAKNSSRSEMRRGSHCIAMVRGLYKSTFLF